MNRQFLLFTKESKEYPEQTLKSQIRDPQDRKGHQQTGTKFNTKYFGSIMSEFD